MTAIHGHERPYERCFICKKRYCPEDEDCDCNPELTEEENRELFWWRSQCGLEDEPWR